jgi:hypothetical protein
MRCPHGEREQTHGGRDAIASSELLQNTVRPEIDLGRRQFNAEARGHPSRRLFSL